VIHVHDIYLPFDYPSGHLRRLWSEQYLLATAPLFGRDAFGIPMPYWYVSQGAGLSSSVDDLLRHESLADLSAHGASIWLRKI